MSHLSHDGKKYFSKEKRDEADKAFAKSCDQCGRNSHNTGDKWDKEAWDKWYAQWPSIPWNSWYSTSTAPADGELPDVAPATGKTITVRHDCGRFTCSDTNEGHYAGITCQSCQTDWFYPEMFHRLCNRCDKQFPE